MTSEVLIFNKRGVVLAADSAVTTSPNGSNQKPRYAKSANKIFELSDAGNVAVAIFGGASIDAVPWELAVKLFRASLGLRRLATIAEYVTELIGFLQAHPVLFPPELLDRFEVSQFEEASVRVLAWVKELNPVVFDDGEPAAARAAAWTAAAQAIRAQLEADGLKPCLTAAAYDAALAQVVGKWDQQLSQNPGITVALIAAIDMAELARLAHLFRFARPDALLGSTGVVVVGYGEAEIFPGYCQLNVHGHIGRELFWTTAGRDSIAHDKGSLIVSLAQKSMIDLFTEGHGFPLFSIIYQESAVCLDAFVADLRAAGVDLTGVDVTAMAQTRHTAFTDAWRKKNWQENYWPLMEF